MKARAPEGPSGNSRAVTVKVGTVRPGARKTGKTDGKSARRLPVDRVLPPTLTEELRKAVAGGNPLSREHVERLDLRFGIYRRYGVSRQRLQDFLKKLSGPSAGARGTVRADDGADEDTKWANRLGTHRRRQASVAAILDQTFGESARDTPHLWAHRAYLLLVGLVYERLATSENEISTEELVKLAKVLSENRRFRAVKGDGRSADQAAESEPAPRGELPERFADIVRQVYGTNLQAPSAQ